MINDILEQLAEDYFRNLGYFTQHNVKYKPNKKGPLYAVHSDIDIIGIHPKKRGISRVIVASCKSWHSGLRIERELKAIKSEHKKTTKVFREVAIKIWSRALINKVKELTGQNNFEFYFVVTKYNYNKTDLWETEKIFNNNLKDCKIILLDVRKMLSTVNESLIGITPSHDELTRLLQMIKYSGGKIEYK